MAFIAALVWNIGWAIACFFCGRFVVRSNSHEVVKLLAISAIVFFFVAIKISFEG